MRADSLFSALQGGSAGEAVTRPMGRAGGSPEGSDAFASMLDRAQADGMPSARPARNERPGSPGAGNTMAVVEDGPPAEAGAAAATALTPDAEGPQVLPHNPPVTERADSKDVTTGPQVLPGGDDTVESPDAPPVLPHNPPVLDVSKIKDRAGPQILPGEATATGAGKGAQLPQINPGPPTGPDEGTNDDPNGPAADNVVATNQGSARTLPDGEAVIPPPPAVTRRLLATHEARENGKAREADRTADKGVGAKVATAGDAAASPLQGASSAAPPQASSFSPNPAMSTAGQGAQPTPDLVVTVPHSDPETPAPPSGDTGSADLSRSSLAPADRGNALSTLSRATVETTAQIAAQIQNRLNGRSTRFEMALTPEGLGRVDVSLEIDSDGNLAARLAFDNPAAAAELRGRADELRRQLEQAGLHLESDALQFTERDPSSGGSGFSGFDRKPFARAAALNTETDTGSAGAAVWQPLTLTRDRVDLKV